MIVYIINIGNAFTWAGQTGGTKNKLIRFPNTGSGALQDQNIVTGINLSVKSSNGVGSSSVEKNSIPLSCYIKDEQNHFIGYAPDSSTSSQFFFVSKGDYISFDIYWYFTGNSDSSRFKESEPFQYVATASNKYDYGFAFYIDDCVVY